MAQVPAKTAARHHVSFGATFLHLLLALMRLCVLRPILGRACVLRLFCSLLPVLNSILVDDSLWFSFYLSGVFGRLVINGCILNLLDISLVSWAIISNCWCVYLAVKHATGATLTNWAATQFVSPLNSLTNHSFDIGTWPYWFIFLAKIMMDPLLRCVASH